MFFRKAQKAGKFLEIFGNFYFFNEKKIFFSDEQKYHKKKEKKIKEKNFIKFLSGRGSKSLPLTIFLAEKTEPNYDTVHYSDS
jgi:hypothetical protein